MPAQLREFIGKNKERIVREATREVRRKASGKMRVSPAILRERFARTLEDLEKWLDQRTGEDWVEMLEPYAQELLEREVPLSRLVRSMLTLKSVVLRHLARFHGRDLENYSRHVALCDEFFGLFLYAFGKSYELQSQRWLREAEWRHDSFFRNLIFPAFLADLGGAIRVVNPAMTKYMQVPEDRLVGRHITEIICDEGIPREHASDFWGTLQKKRKVDRMLLTFTCPESGPLYLEMSSTFFKNLDGEDIGIQGFMQDVTRRIISERMAENHRRTLQTVFDNVPVGMVFTDRARDIQLMNKKFTKNLGVEENTRDEAVGTPIQERIKHAPKYHENSDEFRRFLTGFLDNDKFRASLESQLLNGKIVKFHLAPIFSSRRDYIGHIMINRDITRERELEQLRENLTQMIVHDLKNPLSAISMSQKVLSQILESNGERAVQHSLEIIDRNVADMLRMIMNLLDISRMEENKLELNRKPVDIWDLLDKLQPTLDTIVEQRELKISSRRPLPKLRVDPDIMGRVIENIVGNAVKHTRPKGQIKVSVRREGDRALNILICDDGEGIRKEDQKRIFEKFGQAKARSKGRKTDTGLGLTFCKLAVEAHGGSIHLKSEIGKGSTFTIRMPLHNGREKGK